MNLTRKKFNKILDNVLNKFDRAYFLQKNNGYYKTKWNVFTCGMGTYVACGNTLEETFYSLMLHLARFEGNCEFFDTDLLKFATKNNLI